MQQLSEDPNVELRSFPNDELQHLKVLTKEIMAEMIAKDPAVAKIGRAYYDYLDKSAANSRITQQAYLNTRKD